MLFIALRESERIVAFVMFESIANCVPLRIANDSSVNIEHTFGSLYIRLPLEFLRHQWHHINGEVFNCICDYTYSVALSAGNSI